MAERRAPFVDANDLLLREVHDGPVATARVVLGVLAGVLAVWLVLLVAAVRTLAADLRSRASQQPRSAVPAPR